MIPTAESSPGKALCPGTAIPVFIHVQYSWQRFLDLRHIVEFVGLLFDHHTIFIDWFVFHRILDKPTDLLARPNHVLYRTRLLLSCALAAKAN